MVVRQYTKQKDYLAMDKMNISIFSESALDYLKNILDPFYVVNYIYRYQYAFLVFELWNIFSASLR